MSSWYDGWREAKKRLALKPDDEFLSNLVDNLRGLALQEYVERAFRWMDREDLFEPGDITEDDVQKFLDGLDELRQPLQTAVDEELRKQSTKVLVTLDQMRALPWSGDHLYGDALDDAQEVLRHMLAGKDGWPVLERFRCPSISKETGLQCQKQLPHDSDHSHDVPGGNGLRWTDEASTNPPKAYDSDAEELSGHPVRKQYAETIDAANRCPSEQKLKGELWRCVLVIGHDGDHEGYSGVTWRMTSEALLCAAKPSSAGLVQRCDLPAGHTGDHQDDGSMARWS